MSSKQIKKWVGGNDNDCYIFCIAHGQLIQQIQSLI